jgi:hypothetical protein
MVLESQQNQNHKMVPKQPLRKKYKHLSVQSETLSRLDLLNIWQKEILE